MTMAATDVVRALYRRMAVGDHDGTRELLAEDLRWRQASAGVPAAGADALGRDLLIERVIRPLENDWDDFTEEVEDLRGHVDTVVTTGTYRGTYRTTGRHLEAEFCHLWAVREGRVTAFRQFTDTAAFVIATTAVDPAPPPC
ncbi:nuclear transport factor 2 family protein [soil metagenome]